MNLDAIAGYDPRSDFQAQFNMVDINTPDGDFGYLVGTEGRFTDINGKVWHGSTVLSMSSLQSAIGDAAPAGSISLAYFQDPSQPDLQSQIIAMGPDYLRGRKIEFYWQPFTTMAEMYAPTIAPILEYTRVMGDLVFNRDGPQGRSITLPFEAWTEGRNYKRRIPFSREGHERLRGVTDPSLTYRPTDSLEEEKLFG